MTSRPHLLAFQSRDDGLFFAAHLSGFTSKGVRLIERTTSDPAKAIHFQTVEDATQAWVECGSPSGWRAVLE